jgi:hypothetical protein
VVFVEIKGSSNQWYDQLERKQKLEAVSKVTRVFFVIELTNRGAWGPKSKMNVTAGYRDD